MLQIPSHTTLRPVSLDDLAPIEVAARLQHLPGFVFFDSALEGSPASQVSIVAAEPRQIFQGKDERAWQEFSEELQRRRCDAQSDLGIPHGFAAGYVEYGGQFEFGMYDTALFYFHRTGQWLQLGNPLGRVGRDPAPPQPWSTQPHFRSEMRKEEFCQMVRRAHDYIEAGDIYQVNLAHRFETPFTGDPFSFYERLRQYSPAPYAAYLRLGERAILSASPESFLKMSGRHIRTRPIKGTRPRHADPHADEKSAYDLLTSPKEISELVMITDLERNDLGQVCDWGSVTVRELLALERYEHVFHLVSTVDGQLREDVDHVQALRACFPGGSITGAPKKRAREIITELERQDRGVYTGAIGWLGFNGESQFSIAIRTAIVENGTAHFHVGAGIVADSVPEQEWQETLDKAAGILRAAAAAD